MLKIKKARLIFVLFTAIIILGLFITSFQRVSAANQDDFITIIVKDGDTLWNIAQKHTTGKDIRKAIYEIEKLNNIKKSIIYTGQQLKIPASQID